MADALTGLARIDALVLFGSVARTATENGTDQNGRGARYLHVVIDVTVVPGSAPSLVVTIQAKDPASGKYYTILASAALVGVGTTILRVGPALTAATNLVANDIIPRIWRVIVTAGNANSATYSIGANLG